MTSAPFSRHPEQGDAVPQPLIPKLFAAKPGETVTASDATGSYVAQLDEVQKPERPSQTAAAELSRELDAEQRADLDGRIYPGPARPLPGRDPPRDGRPVVLSSRLRRAGGALLHPPYVSKNCMERTAHHDAEPLAVYIHWPFCRSKCPYCDFNSHVRDSVDDARWTRALLADLDQPGGARARTRRSARCFSAAARRR